MDWWKQGSIHNCLWGNFYTWIAGFDFGIFHQHNCCNFLWPSVVGLCLYHTPNTLVFEQMVGNTPVGNFYTWIGDFGSYTCRPHIFCKRKNPPRFDSNLSNNIYIRIVDFDRCTGQADIVCNWIYLVGFGSSRWDRRRNCDCLEPVCTCHSHIWNNQCKTIVDPRNCKQSTPFLCSPQRIGRFLNRTAFFCDCHCPEQPRNTRHRTIGVNNWSGNIRPIGRNNRGSSTRKRWRSHCIQDRIGMPTR